MKCECHWTQQLVFRYLQDVTLFQQYLDTIQKLHLTFPQRVHENILCLLHFIFKLPGNVPQDESRNYYNRFNYFQMTIEHRFKKIYIFIGRKIMRQKHLEKRKEIPPATAIHTNCMYFRGLSLQYRTVQMLFIFLH